MADNKEYDPQNPYGAAPKAELNQDSATPVVSSVQPMSEPSVNLDKGTKQPASDPYSYPQPPQPAYSPYAQQQQPYPYPQQGQYPQGQYYPQQGGQHDIYAILGLIFAFVFPLLGVIFSIISLSRIGKGLTPFQPSDKGLAIAGVIVGAIAITINLIWFFVLIGSLSPSTYSYDY